MFEGKIVKSGGPELADQIETGGYDPILGVKTGDPMAAGATA
jgi:Fe-S cluster assembly ATPase SufC